MFYHRISQNQIVDIEHSFFRVFLKLHQAIEAAQINWRCIIFNSACEHPPIFTEIVFSEGSIQHLKCKKRKKNSWKFIGIYIVSLNRIISFEGKFCHQPRKYPHNILLLCYGCHWNQGEWYLRDTCHPFWAWWCLLLPIVPKRFLRGRLFVSILAEILESIKNFQKRMFLI